MKTYIVTIILSLIAVFACPNYSRGHCDTYGGPVVQAAKRALETQNINHVLIWIQKKDEHEIEEAFRKALKVRKLGQDAKELADQHFFETVVRIHRMGEGAPYTGLRSDDADLGPAIPAADESIAKGNIGSVEAMLAANIRTSLHHQFDALMKKKDFATNDVDKGREYVAAYVEFIHFVERIFESAQKPAHGHFEDVGSEHLH